MKVEFEVTGSVESSASLGFVGRSYFSANGNWLRLSKVSDPWVPNMEERILLQAEQCIEVTMGLCHRITEILDPPNEIYDV